MSRMTFPRRVEGVLFDMDGVLFDTEAVYLAALLEAAEAVGSSMTLAFGHSMIGVPGPDCDVMIRVHFGPDFPMADYDRAYDAAVIRRLEAGIPLKAGVVELLDYMERSGLPVAIATSSGRPTVERYLAQAALAHRFPIAVCRHDVTNCKPHPEVFATAAARIGLAPSACLALEDSYHGVRAAHAAGAMTMMVPDLLAPDESIRALCVAVARDLHEVRELLVAAEEGTPNDVPGKPD